MRLPKFFRKNSSLLSIDFGQSFVKILYLERQGEDFKLCSYDLKKILAQGENRLEIIDFIANFLKTNSILEKEAYLTISDPESLIIRHLIQTH